MEIPESCFHFTRFLAFQSRRNLQTFFLLFSGKTHKFGEVLCVKTSHWNLLVCQREAERLWKVRCEKAGVDCVMSVVRSRRRKGKANSFPRSQLSRPLRHESRVSRENFPNGVIKRKLSQSSSALFRNRTDVRFFINFSLRFSSGKLKAIREIY